MSPSWLSAAHQYPGNNIWLALYFENILNVDCVTTYLNQSNCTRRYHI